MTGIATVDKNERIRATRVEVARLQGLRYREKLTAWQEAVVLVLIQRHMQTLPAADQDSIAETELERENPPMDWSVLNEEWAEEAVTRAARIVADQWSVSRLEADIADLEQAARIILAERAEMFRKARKPTTLLVRELVHLVRYKHEGGFTNVPVAQAGSFTVSSYSEDDWEEA